MYEAEPVGLASNAPDRRGLTGEERDALRKRIDERQRARLGFGPGSLAEHDVESVRAFLLRRGEATAAEIEYALGLPSTRARGAIRRLRLAGKARQVRRNSHGRWRLT